MAAHEWIAERSRDFTALCGRRVESWIGVEMALRDEGPDGLPQFEDPEVPCLQLLGLMACLDDGGFLSVSTYQDNDTWGLWPRPHLEPRYQDERPPDSGFRCRPLTELPTGQVERVTTFLDDGQLAEARLQIDTRPLFLIAGELDEDWEGDLHFRWLDESVLAFTDPAAAAHVSWATSRPSPTRLDDTAAPARRAASPRWLRAWR
jgi:hypothetical protein